MDYTVELYRLDRRYKEGRVLWSKTDYVDTDLSTVETACPVRRGYVRFIYETWVTRKNLMTGELFRERYDTPWSCSPASESFWSN